MDLPTYMREAKKEELSMCQVQPW